MKNRAWNIARIAAAFIAVCATGFLGKPLMGQGDTESQKVRVGLASAPVPLKLDGKDKNEVGLGSYLVNVGSECNGCHSLGPATQFLAGGSPYFGQKPTKVNPETYLGGGRDFGALIPGSASIVSRNLTPDKAGKPAGMDKHEFRQLLKTGIDGDKWHPMCVGAPAANCIPAPFDGSLLQIMPWPAYQEMTARDMNAIYEYLSAIPCIEGDPGNPAGADTKGQRCR